MASFRRLALMSDVHDLRTPGHKQSPVMADTEESSSRSSASTSLSTTAEGKPLPSTPPHVRMSRAAAISTQSEPQWQRELARARPAISTRSRASSVMSFQTRMTVLSDDTRSIDIDVAGRTFHITRDGGNVQELTSPPPYPGPPLEEVPEESDDEDTSTLSGSSRTSRANSRTRSETNNNLARSQATITSEQDTDAEDVLPIPVSPTTKRLTMLELPQKLRSAFLNWASSTTGMPVTTAGTDTEVNNTSRLHALRRTQSESSSFANFRIQVQDSSNVNEDETAIVDDSEQPNRGNSNANTATTGAELIAATIAGEYRRLMRELDREQRMKLHERDEELAQLRMLLDEKDRVLRQQLREKDFVIETLEDDLQSKESTIRGLIEENSWLQQDMAGKIEKARHQVEDAWERRWKEYEKVLRDNGFGKAVEFPTNSQDELLFDFDM